MAFSLDRLELIMTSCVHFFIFFCTLDFYKKLKKEIDKQTDRPTVK